MNELLITEIARPGERIDLQSVPNEYESDAEKKSYISKIYDINDETQFEIFMPVEQTKLKLLSVGEEFAVYIYAQKGIYTCRVVVSQRYKNDTAVVAVLDIVSPFSKHQRREYYRFSTIIGMAARGLEEEEERLYLDGETLLEQEPSDKGVIVDISGGGLRFVAAAKYELNMLVQCKFILNFKDENVTIDCVVRILGSKPVANNKENTEYRGQFLDLNNFERENIIRFIFEEERKIRHRR